MTSNVEENEEDTKDEQNSIVIVTGSFSTHAGFTGDESPPIQFPTVIRKSNNCDPVIGTDVFNTNSNKIKLSHPIQWGICDNIDDIEIIYNHIFTKQLKIDCTEYGIFTSLSIENPKQSLENLTKMVFESFKCPTFYLAKNSQCISYASGRTTSLIVEIGHMVTRTVPLYEGYCLPHAALRCDLAGRDIEQYLKKLLNEKGHNLDVKIIRDIKQKLCYTAIDYENEEEIKQEYELPDGKLIEIDVERFKSVECLFKPSLIGLEYMGIVKMINESITKCEQEIQNDLYNGIILSGGSSMFKGMGERIYKEMKSLTNNERKINIIAPPERKYSVWIGGSIFSSLSTFENMWISKSEYEENGAAIVHKKCM